MIANMFDGGALQSIERTLQFTATRHTMLTNNIANLDTPYFKPTDISPRSFHETLGEAVDDRRKQRNPLRGRLDIRDTRELKFTDAGLFARAQQTNAGILYHDQNNRDLERTMQHLAENTLAHNAAVEMMRNQFEMLRTAIRGRL
jgi:flagellar basal-body rod protein FlgB